MTGAPAARMAALQAALADGAGLEVAVIREGADARVTLGACDEVYFLFQPDGARRVAETMRATGWAPEAARLLEEAAAVCADRQDGQR